MILSLAPDLTLRLNKWSDELYWLSGRQGDIGGVKQLDDGRQQQVQVVVQVSTELLDGIE